MSYFICWWWSETCCPNPPLGLQIACQNTKVIPTQPYYTKQVENLYLNELIYETNTPPKFCFIPITLKSISEDSPPCHLAKLKKCHGFLSNSIYTEPIIILLVPNEFVLLSCVDDKAGRCDLCAQLSFTGLQPQYPHLRKSRFIEPRAMYTKPIINNFVANERSYLVLLAKILKYTLYDAYRSFTTSKRFINWLLSLADITHTYTHTTVVRTCIKSACRIVTLSDYESKFSSVIRK